MRLTVTRGLAAAAIGIGLGFALPAFAGDITVSQPYARASAGKARNGAAFMTLENSGASADALVSAKTPVAAHAELHTHVMDGDIMRMRAVQEIDVPAGGSTTLQPGGMHVMLLGLKAPLKEGETFPLTLKFKKAGRTTVQVPVKSAAEGAPAPMPMHQTH